jgi:FixJ family two-component response regulator
MRDGYLHDKRFVQERKYDVKQLWDSHAEMVRRIALGQNNVEIAQALGVTPQTVSNIKNSPLAKEKVDELQGAMDENVKDIHKRIQALQPEALSTLEGVLRGEYDQDPQPVLKTKVATTLLAMGGNGPVQKVHSLHEHVTRDDIEKLKERAREAAKLQGVLAAEYHEVSK